MTTITATYKSLFEVPLDKLDKYTKDLSSAIPFAKAQADLELKVYGAKYAVFKWYIVTSFKGSILRYNETLLRVTSSGRLVTDIYVDGKSVDVLLT